MVYVVKYYTKYFGAWGIDTMKTSDVAVVSSWLIKMDTRPKYYRLISVKAR